MKEDKILLKDFNHEIKDLDEAQGIVTMYINAFGNEDTDGDISSQGSFKRTFKNNLKIIKHLLNHNGDYLLGLPKELYEDEKGAIAVSQMNMKKQIVKDVFEDYRLFASMKRSLDHSIRVRAIKRDTQDERIVLEWKLWEYSTLYTWGANPNTPMLNIKSMNELEVMMRDGNYSDEKAKEIEQLYEKLKQLIADPQSTPSGDPQALSVKRFYEQIKF